MLEWGRTSRGVATVKRDGVAVATARRAAVRGDVYADIDGVSWLFFTDRHGMLGERNGAAEATLRATRPGRSRYVWDVHADRAVYRLERTRRLTGRFAVRRDGTEIAMASGRRWVGSASLDANVDMPLEHQVFLLCLITAKRCAANLGRGGGASVASAIPGSTAFGSGLGTDVGGGIS